MLHKFGNVLIDLSDVIAVEKRVEIVSPRLIAHLKSHKYVIEIVASNEEELDKWFNEILTVSALIPVTFAYTASPANIDNTPKNSFGE